MSAIPQKQLGRNGTSVPRLGFGLMGLSAWTGEKLPDEERFKLLDHAVELGETFWDTSDVYGDSEDLLGEWFKRTGKRDQIFLASKFGGPVGAASKPDSKDHKIRTDPAYVKQACQRSLDRLGVDTIDLYYVHRVDFQTPIEHTVQAMVELKAEGKIKYLGLSEVSAKTLRRAHAVHPITAVQMEYSPYSIEIEDPTLGLLNACRELGVAVVAYSPLSKGLVTGQLRGGADFEAKVDLRRVMPRFAAENLPTNLVTRKIKYLEENLDSANMKLTPAELAEIRKAVESADVAGNRYPKGMDVQLFADTPEL
ncbi:pyridoxine 4-dehydrogenase [Botryosphaeria dothidea]|uniref:Pyridoxine 4-dehydrogenase n=1 Tax=Botryosphaeria dothidea TaxID=55169 RepID=A0A8H4IK50_9PEZI|nr:pyridoxine 4-dehydrogenase [Botryosphaeria dothidea]